MKYWNEERSGVQIEKAQRQTIRDEPFTAEFYRLLFSFIKLAFTWRGKEGQARVEKAEAIFWNTIRFPEFEARGLNV